MCCSNVNAKLFPFMFSPDVIVWKPIRAELGDENALRRSECIHVLGLYCVCHLLLYKHAYTDVHMPVCVLDFLETIISKWAISFGFAFFGRFWIFFLICVHENIY